MSGLKPDFLPGDWTLGEHLGKTHVNLDGVTRVITRLTADQLSDRQWSEYEMHSSTLRITDLEKLVGDTVGPEAASVWSSISLINSNVSDTEKHLSAQIAAKYAALELELDYMLEGVKIFRDSLNLKA